ncbi:MAG: SprT family zinc-dependent metalloprotease [Planctomycetota bacterium]
MTRTYGDIPYQLAKTHRKTASILIERDGQVSIRVPKELTDNQVEKLIENKRTWIYKALAEWSDLNATRVHRAFVNGEGYLYLGRSYRLRMVKDQAEPLMLKNGYFCLHGDPKQTTQTKFVEAFKEFYRQRGRDRIPQRVELFQAKLGLKAKAVNVLELKNRWASCSAKGNLNFHWKCLMAPPTIIDYIIVHELAHLRYANHSAAFWNEVDKLMPDYRERKEWLRVNGAGMDL